MKTVYLSLIFLFLIPFNVCTQTMSSPLRAHRWEHRIVLIFAQQADDQLVEEQIELRQAKSADWAERDLFYFIFTPMGGQDQNGQEFSQAVAQEMYEHYGIAHDIFAVILIGKDGSEKLQKMNQVIPNELLFETIDAMPMRQREMREQEDPR